MERNCLRVIRRAVEYIVLAAILRSVPHNLKLMLVGPHAKNPCASEPSIPSGSWYCKYCKNKDMGEIANAVAAGRVSVIGPKEQITKKPPENGDLIACVLCSFVVSRSNDFDGDGFNDWAVIICDQCEKEYHIGCLRDHNKADLKALPREDWFCSMDCERIHSDLKTLLSHGPKKVPDFLRALIREKQKDIDLESVGNFDVKWMLLRGKDASPETRSLLAIAVDIFHECFDPIIDPTTQSDLIRPMVYGRKVGNQDFEGMYCAILKINSHVVTAGILRIFGQDVAELPIVATRKCYQGKDYFQLLFTCIVRLLSNLHVKKIALPAAKETESLWTNKFGFRKMSQRQLRDYMQLCTPLVSFRRTVMLEKEVPQGQNSYCR